MRKTQHEYGSQLPQRAYRLTRSSRGTVDNNTPATFLYRCHCEIGNSAVFSRCIGTAQTWKSEWTRD